MDDLLQELARDISKGDCTDTDEWDDCLVLAEQLLAVGWTKPPVVQQVKPPTHNDLDELAAIKTWLDDQWAPNVGDLNAEPTPISTLGRIQWLIEQASISAQQPPSEATQADWILVPREPTDAMIDAADDANADYRSSSFPMASLAPEYIWKAMIGAVPEPAVQEQEWRTALKTIAEWPAIDARNMDAQNMRKVAVDGRAVKTAGFARPAPSAFAAINRSRVMAEITRDEIAEIIRGATDGVVTLAYTITEDGINDAADAIFARLGDGWKPFSEALKCEGFTAQQLFATIVNHERELASAFAKEDGQLTKLEREEEEIYRAGVEQGRSDAVQAIDRLTGGDGEYRCSSEPDRHVPDSPAMMARIESRFKEVCTHLEVTAARAKTAEAERDAALKEATKYAKEAGKATGKLEMSETASVVEGWRNRADAAEAKVDELEHLAEQESDEALNTLHAALDRAATAEARTTALEARVKALEEALTDAIDDLKTTLRSAFMGWECSESELLDRYCAALAQSGEC